LLSQLLGFLIFNSGINFRIMSIILAVLISVLCSAIAAIYPIKQALRVNLAQNLRGE
jgi:putative membrane protein